MDGTTADGVEIEAIIAASNAEGRQMAAVTATPPMVESRGPLVIRFRGLDARDRDAEWTDRHDTRWRWSVDQEGAANYWRLDVGSGEYMLGYPSATYAPYTEVIPAPKPARQQTVVDEVTLLVDLDLLIPGLKEILGFVLGWSDLLNISPEDWVRGLESSSSDGEAGTVPGPPVEDGPAAVHGHGAAAGQPTSSAAPGLDPAQPTSTADVAADSPSGRGLHAHSPEGRQTEHCWCGHHWADHGISAYGSWCAVPCRVDFCFCVRQMPIADVPADVPAFSGQAVHPKRLHRLTSRGAGGETVPAPANPAAGAGTPLTQADLHSAAYAAREYAAACGTDFGIDYWHGIAEKLTTAAAIA